jgi:hypothetical protein
MPIHWSAILTALVLASVQFVLFLRWLHRRMRNDEIVCAFVRHMAQTISRASIPPCTPSRASRELNGMNRPWCHLSNSKVTGATTDHCPTLTQAGQADRQMTRLHNSAH